MADEQKIESLPEIEPDENQPEPKLESEPEPDGTIRVSLTPVGERSAAR